MRVLCIDASPGRWNCAHLMLVEGEKYTAFQSPDHEDAYELEEIKYHPKDGGLVNFSKKRFIPCSEIDEMERYEEKFYDLIQ